MYINTFMHAYICMVGQAKMLHPGTLTSHQLDAWKTIFPIFKHLYIYFSTLDADIAHTNHHLLHWTVANKPPIFSFRICCSYVVCLSVCVEQHRSSLDRFWWNMIFELFFFQKSVKIQVVLKFNKNGHFTWRLFTFMTIYDWIILKMRNFLNQSCRGNQNINFMYSKFFPKILLFMR